MRKHTHYSSQHSHGIPVVMIRHAQSVWNSENRFTGWANPPLTDLGIDEAHRAAHCLQHYGFQFDMAFSSRLLRAVSTRDILLDNMQLTDIPRFEDWRLNERHYGALQGVNKAEAAQRVGDNQVWRWRRGYLDKALPLHHSDPHHPRHDVLYADVDPSRLPGVENLADTRLRVTEFWRQQIRSGIERRQRVLISAHGNTLRALLMELDGMNVEQVESLEIPTGVPIIYWFDAQGAPLEWRYLEPCSAAA